MEQTTPTRRKLHEKEPLAIIGMSARLPGDIYGPEGLWSKLSQGVDGITDVPGDRWSIEKYYDPDPDKAGKIKSKKGGFIKGMAEFDAEFFDIYPKVAERMDPRQRHLLEVSYEAIEDAGLTLDELDGSLTACTMGVFLGDDSKKNAHDALEEITPHTAMGSADTTVPARLAFSYNLRGPVFSVDTACSSSLVAIHLACQAIWTGDADMAISGGVNIMEDPGHSIELSKGGFLSPDGYCKTFDASGNGYVRGEGVGVVILKPLSDAEAAGDQIYAVIRNTVSNSDGYTADGMTVPNEFAQMDMLKKAYGDVGIHPADVDYMEAHGTGTSVGDPKETYAFGHVFADGRDANKPLVMGSIKSNIGHTEAVAGVAGLMKLAQAINHKEIPRNLHFKTPNPGIKFDEWKLKVPTEQTPWPETGDRPARGGVNSFGAGGTNAHAVLEEYVPTENRKEDKPADEKRYEFPMVFDLSAKSEAGLKATADRYVDYLQETEESLASICYSLNKRRTKHTHRVIISASSKEGVAQALQAFIRGDEFDGVVTGTTDKDKKLKIAFVCSGQGPQWYAMGRQLMETSEVFRQTVKDIDVIFNRLSGYSLWEEMNRDKDETRIGETRIAQPSIMAMQIGLIHMWRELGVEPEGLVGHSIGEVAAAYGSGALTLEQAVDVIYNRSKEQDRASGAGVMLAVGQTLADAMKEIRGVEDRVSIAAINGPEMLTLAGDKEPIEEIAKRLEEKEVFNKFLRVSVPFHSHHMEPLKEDLLAGLAHLEPGEAKTPLYSTVTGQEEDGLHLTSDYWYSNVRDTVYFTAAIEEMINDGYNVFVEIAPHPVLGASVNDMLGSMNKQGTIITSARRDIKKFEGGVKYEESTFLRGASQLAITGAKVDWTVLYQGSDAKYVKLPRYVWQHQEFWSETKEHRKWRTEVDAHPLVENFQFGADSAVNTFNLRPDKRVEKWLVDHVIDDVLVVPGTGQVEMANTVGKMKYGEDFNFVEDLNFDQALTLPDDGPSPYVRLRFISQEEGEYVIESADREDDELVWKQHSSGKMNFLGDSFESRTADLEVIRQRCTEAVDVTAMYQDVASYGLKYGPTFRLVQDMNLGGDAEILSTVKLHDSLGYGADRFAFHPALLDASLHTIFGQRKSYNGKKGNYLPAHIDRVKVYQKPDAEVLVYVKMTRNDADFLNGDYIIMNLDGTVVAEIQGLVCKYVKGSRGESLDSDYEGVAEYVWQAASIDELLEGKDAGEPKVGNVLVLADGTGVGEHMINALKGKVDNLFVARKGDAYAENTVDGVKEFTLPLSKYSDKLDLQEAGDDKSPEKLQPEYEQELALYSQMIQAAGANSIDKIVYLWGLDNTVNDDTDSETFTRQSQDLFFGAVNTIKALTTANEDYTGQFWFVTQGLERVTHAEEQINFGQGGMYGIMRVLVNEYPSIAVRAVDLENHAGAEQLDLLVSEVTTYGEVLKNVEVALRGTDRYQRVATQVTAEDAEDRAARKMNAAGAWFHADVKTIGDAESIVFREKVQADLGAGEVLVEVKAAGVSKVDVDIVMSPESEEEASFGYTGNRLGREAAGVVKAVGEGVSALAVGDEVYGWVNEGVAGMATALERTLAKKPAHISFEEAATITVPFMTAHYALGSLAQLDEGERILIHNANTGIGVAAIHFAQKLGAEIFATAKTEEQRQYVRDLGVEHVFDSDSGKSEFYKGILKAIGSTEEEKKRGVIDVVLNSLSGKATTQSMRLLRDFGRFIELSKEDINDNRQLSLANFGRNLAYFAMDMDRLVKNKPRVATRIFQEVVALFENKTVTPVSPKVFSVGDTQEAIKFLADGENIGKVALSIDGELSLLPMKELRLMKNGSYLISGGMGGLGLTLARNFAGLGAGTVVLLSRSGRAKTDRDKRLIQEMEDMGTKVLMPTGDVADYARIQEVIAELKDEAPLRGVVHSAALMKDSTFGNMGPGTYYKAFQAKALGAFNLHKAVKDIDTVDFFMPISSISAFVGLPGQSNYSAANNFEDKLSLHRQVLGLRGSAIQYGVLSGEIAGLSREVGEETVLKVLEQQGWDIMPENRIVNHANRLILDQAPFRMHADMHWGQFGEFFAHLQKDSRFEEVLKNAKQGSGGEGGGSLLDQLKNLDEDGRNAKLQEEAQGALAKILGTSADKIDIDKSISKIGLDSLMLNQLRNWIQGKLEINFPLMKIAKGPTIIELAEEILKIVELDTAAGAGDSGAAKDAKPAVKEIPTMTENGVTFEAKDGLWISKDNWLARAEGVNDNASLQMFCMHGMGGESEMFFPFMLSSPKDTKVFTMQQPGRGHGSGATMDRSGEPQYAKSEQLLEKMMEVLLPWLNKPTIFWGHSMGGMELWEISRRLKANHPEAYANVKGLVISGTASPIALDNWKTKRMLVDSLNLPVDASEERLDELVEHFRAMMPELQSATFLKRVIQVMGRDMRMWHDFEPDPNRVPLDLPLLALASTEDGVTPFEEEFLPWKQEVEEGKFDLVEFLGDHWFLTTRVKKKEADGSFATDEKGNTIELANNEEIVKENIQRFINQWVG